MGYIIYITKENSMKVGDLIKPVFNESLYLILKIVSGNDIPPIVRNPDSNDELLLEVTDSDGMIMHLFNYECEVVS
mgnify:CR=1 FL=1